MNMLQEGGWGGAREEGSSFSKRMVTFYMRII
jgi:hypothetical protein